MSTRPATAPAPDSLDVLMRRVQHGDDAAFADLYKVSHVRVGCVIGRTLQAPDHASEVLQEVFLYAWEHAHAYDAARGTVIGWLTMVARRRAIDRIRTVARSVARDHRSSLDPSSSVVPDIADLGIARHDAGRLRAAVHQLSAKQREAVALTYLSGYTQQEAATLLRVPLGTLKSRVRDGVANLRSRCSTLVA